VVERVEPLCVQRCHSLFRSVMDDGDGTICVDPEASVATHLERIRTYGERYLSAALNPSLVPARSRARALDAALQHTAAAAGRADACELSQSVSQYSQRAPHTQQSRAVTALASAVGALVDESLPPDALVRAANAAADAMLLPVLTKVLCVLARIPKLRREYSAEEEEAEGEEASEAERPGRKILRKGLVDQGTSDDGEGDDNDDDDEDALLDDDAPLIQGTSKRSRSNRKRSKEPPKKASKTVMLPSAATCSGQDFVNEFLINITKPVDRRPTQARSSRFRKEDGVFVANAAREAPLSALAINVVLCNLISRLPAVDIFELPAFIYQVMLLVSAKGNAQAKRGLIRSVVQLFASMEESARTAVVAASQAQDADEDSVIMSHATSMVTLREIEGTTLLHIDFAIKQDRAMVSEILKSAKLCAESPQSIMTSFGLALLLSLSRAPALQSSILDVIVDAVTRFDKECRIRKENSFAHRLARHDEPVRDPRSALLSIVGSSVRGAWEIVVEPLLQLGLHLMDKGTRPVEPRGADISIQIVSALFCSHPHIRGEIVDQLISRVVLRERSALLALETLNALVRRSSTFVLDHVGRIKESLSDLVTMSPWMSSLLIDTYMPLFGVRQELRDFAFIALRKALFYRDGSSRAVASSGFLRFMTSPLSGSCSGPATAISAEAVLPLRRALSHPPALRALFYKEVRRLFNANQAGAENLAVCSALRNLLHPHALRYLDASSSPFLVLEHCVSEHDGGDVVEPLGDLIHCLTVIEQAAGNPLSQSYLMDIAKKVSSVSIQDFDISKESRAHTDPRVDVDGETESILNAEEAANIAADKANRNRARVLGGAIESLINVALSADDSFLSIQLFKDVVFPLLHMREEVLTVLKALGSGSFADSFREMGGMDGLEVSSNGGKGIQSRTGKYGLNDGKSIALGKKNRVTSKGPASTNGASSAASNSTGDVVPRFGFFGVLASSSTSPSIELETAVNILALIRNAADRGSGSTRMAAEWFDKNLASSDTAMLSNLLLGAAKTHIASRIESQKTTQGHFFAAPETLSFTKSVCLLAHVSMKTFQYHRGQTGPTHTRSAVRALEIVETCIEAVSAGAQKDADVETELCHRMLPSRSRMEQCTEPGRVVEYTIECLQKVVESLIEDMLCREADVLLRILDTLVRMRERRPRAEGQNCDLEAKIATWARACFLRFENLDAGVMRGLMLLILRPRTGMESMEGAFQLAGRVHTVLGDCSAHDEPTASPPRDSSSLLFAPIICQGNALQAVEVILRTTELWMDDVEWAQARMSAFESAASDTNAFSRIIAGHYQDFAAGSVIDEKRIAELEKTANEAEDSAQHRLGHVARVLQELLRTAIVKWAVQEQLVKSVTRCYRVLSMCVAAQVRRRCDPRASFMAVLDVVKQLAPLVWQYMAFLSTNEKKLHDAEDIECHRAGSSAAKEARIMPQLVYEVERFEKLLMAAQKQTKVKLLCGMKRNTARDFRISADMLSDKENHSDGEDHRLRVESLLREK
jgi:hypothetical protein